MAKKIKKVENEEIKDELDEEINEVEEGEIDPEKVFAACDDLLNAKFFKVDFYKQAFMETRKLVEDANKARTKNKDAEDQYDNVVYNLTSKAAYEPIFQDFMGYAYKKGNYDFCIMNFEKYLKWTLLAAANGNGFSLTRLQLFLNSQLDYIYGQEGQDYIANLLGLDLPRYTLFITKKLCEYIVRDEKINAVDLFKEEEVYVEQSEKIMRKYELIKEKAKDELIFDCNKLYEAMTTLDRKRAEYAMNIGVEPEEEKEEPKELDVEAEAMKNLDSTNKFVKKKPTKKQFRW